MIEYLTVDRESNDSFEVKRSKFIGYVKPVSTVEEASAFISEIKAKHWDAKHNVYAYIIKPQDQQIVKRYSDDGEPQGTAGVPVLDVLEKENVQNVCVVVTRYFGGILLGGGGLVRAYSHAASIALKSGIIITKTLCHECTFRSDYTFFGKFQNILSEVDGISTDTIYEDDVAVTFLIPQENREKLVSKIIDTSCGKYTENDVKVMSSKYHNLHR